MGLLVDGQWHDKWYDTKNTVAALSVANHSFAIL